MFKNQFKNCLFSSNVHFLFLGWFQDFVARLESHIKNDLCLYSYIYVDDSFCSS